MNPAERLGLIRAKARPLAFGVPAKPKAQGLRLASDPDAEPAHRMRKGPDPDMPRRKWRGNVFGPDLYMSQTGAKWTKVPDPTPALTCEVTERQEPHYLDRIAEQLPAKLPIMPTSPS